MRIFCNCYEAKLYKSKRWLKGSCALSRLSIEIIISNFHIILSNATNKFDEKQKEERTGILRKKYMIAKMENRYLDRMSINRSCHQDSGEILNLLSAIFSLTNNSPLSPLLASPPPPQSAFTASYKPYLFLRFTHSHKPYL